MAHAAMALTPRASPPVPGRSALVSRSRRGSASRSRRGVRVAPRAEDMGSSGAFREGEARRASSASRGDDDPGSPLWCRPKRIVLIRHAESEGNVDETMYTRKPDHRIELTEKGKAQAREAGERLKSLLGPGETLYVYVSPYMRTMQTLYELGSVVGADKVLGVREEPRLREQDFGNFQDATMRELKRERLGFGRFFYRFPNGESAADVYDRVTSFRETLRNDIHFGRFNCDATGCKTNDCTVVIVTHGLTLRVFLMRWYKWTTEHFSRLRNTRNAELVVMERGDGGRYSLLNQVQDEAKLTEMGFTEEMIADQRWAREAPADALNADWPTSKGGLFFDSFPERLASARASVRNADAFFERKRREHQAAAEAE